MFKRIAVAAMVVAGAFGTAQAADVPIRPPVYKAIPAPAFDWSGAYIGVYGGYVNGGYRDDTDFQDYSGGLAGVYAGYNWQFNRNWVIGIEGDFGWAFTDEDGGTFGPAADIELKWLSSIRGRIGYAMNNVLLYATGGIAFAEQRFHNGLIPSEVKHNGWIAGLGIEYALNRNWVVRAEYLHYEFDPETYFIGVGPFRANIEPGDIFRIGVGWKR